MDYQIFVNLFNSLIEAANAQGGALVADGIELTKYLLLFMIAWFLLQMLLNEDVPETIASILNTAFKAVFIVFLLNSWNGGFVSDFFGSTMDQIAQKVSGPDGSSSAGIQGIVKMIEAVNRANKAQVVCTEVEAPATDAMGNPTPGGGKVVNCTDQSGGIGSLLKVLGSPVMWLIAAGLKLLTTGVLALLAAVYMLVVNLGAVLIGVAMTLGPILVPWFLIPPGSFLFDGWLRFMITAGLMKVVGAVLMTIVNAAILVAKGYVDTTIAHIEDVTTVDTFAMIVICIITCIGVFLMWQAPIIAAGLVSGASKTSPKGFGEGMVGRKIAGKLGII